jgi:hypothetical protein
MMRGLIGLGTLVLTGCVTAAAPGAAGVCNAAPAQGLVGQRASSESGARALALTGARTLRWGPPGTIWTMDYRTDRVNIRYDAALVIVEASCG